MIFFYDFPKYTWIYFLRFKSDVLSVFILFRTFVEQYLDCSIRSFQTDWVGEFQALTSYFCDNGITQRSCCPYTTEQNDCLERKHRHIVETGRT